MPSTVATTAVTVSRQPLMKHVNRENLLQQYAAGKRVLITVTVRPITGVLKVHLSRHGFQRVSQTGVKTVPINIPEVILTARQTQVMSMQAQMQP